LVAHFLAKGLKKHSSYQTKAGMEIDECNQWCSIRIWWSFHDKNTLLECKNLQTSLQLESHICWACWQLHTQLSLFPLSLFWASCPFLRRSFHLQYNFGVWMIDTTPAKYLEVKVTVSIGVPHGSYDDE
jgi:hypothetical protein